MERLAGQKLGNHLRLVRVERTPEEWLDLEFAEAIVALQVPKGRRRPKRLYRVAAGETHPLRVPARVLSDAVSARIPVDAVVGAMHRALKRYAARKCRRPLTGDHPQAA